MSIKELLIEKTFTKNLNENHTRDLKTNIKIGFLSHLDSNLYLFRLPIMIELVKNGYEVYAIVPEGKHKNDFKKHNIKTIFYTIDRKSLNIFKELKTIISLYNNINPLSINIINSFMLKPNIYSSLVVFLLRLKRKKIKLICSITGLGSFYIDKSFKSKIVKSATLLLYKISFFIANKVIFQNSDDKKLFIQKNIVKKQKSILIKSSGIDIEKFNPLSLDEKIHKKIKQELKIKQNEVIILMIARLIIHKGIYEYIKVANELKVKYPNARFLLIGGKDNGSHFNIDMEVLKNSNIEYLGEKNNIKEYLSFCDIFTLPSYREGVPRTLLEAGAMSKAIVTTDAIGCREVVKDGVNGFLVKIKDTKELKKAIEILINDKEKREFFAKNSLEKIKNEFDVKYIVKQYIEVYKDIMYV